MGSRELANVRPWPYGQSLMESINHRLYGSDLVLPKLQRVPEQLRHIAVVFLRTRRVRLIIAYAEKNVGGFSWFLNSRFAFWWTLQNSPPLVATLPHPFNTEYATQWGQIPGFWFFGNHNQASNWITICTSLFRIFRKIQWNKRRFPS